MEEFIKQNILQFEMLLKLVIALAQGFAIGVNRELAGKQAGIRTQMLVSGAACLIISMGNVMILNYTALAKYDIIRIDPIHMVSSVITGVAFIGAGTIVYREKENFVEGLTTAATLLFSAVIGIGTGFGQYVVSIGATILAIFVLIFMHKLDKYINLKKNTSNANSKN